MRKEKTVKTDDFETKVLNLSRVERMTAGGRRLRFQAVVVTGDKKSKAGVAAAKSNDVSGAIEKASKMARKKVVEIPITEDTIPHYVEAKYGAAKILLRPQKKGRGLIAGGTVRIICSLGGVKNISAKIIGRTGNKLNNAKATIAALQKLKKPAVSDQKNIIKGADINAEPKE